MGNNVGTAFTNPSIISNCTGLVRGLERGIERTIGPINVITYVEIEAFAVANLVAQMESGLLAPRPIWTNLKTFPAGQFYAKVHGITGGYPCQPFSCAGQRQGTEDPRHLWPFIELQMSAIRPVWGFFENVGDHLSLGFDVVYKSLRRMGYRVEAGIYTAEEAGAPHERERLFILAVADSHRNGYRAGAGGIGGKSGTNERTPQGEDRERLRAILGDSGSGVANAQPLGILQGCQEHKSEQPNQDGIPRRNVANSEGVSQREPADQANAQPAKGGARYEPGNGGEQSLAAGVGQGLEERGEQPAREEQPPFKRSGNTGFPARPGEEQYSWEAPRVIESGLGCSIDGYNFREDLLRGLGNGVVEQTAEIAFRDLLNKHFGKGY